MFQQFKTFSSLEFRLSAVVALLENGLQYHGAVALANICNRQFQLPFTREPDTEIASKSTTPFTPMGEITVTQKASILKLFNNLKMGYMARVLGCEENEF